MENTKNESRQICMDDDTLEQVSGGTSRYEEASGTERDSWLASLVSRLIVNGEDEKKKPQTPQSNQAPLSTIIVGDYTSAKQ